MMDIGRRSVIYDFMTASHCEILCEGPSNGGFPSCGEGFPSVSGGVSIGDSITSGSDFSTSAMWCSNLSITFGRFHGNDYFPCETIFLPS